MIITELYAVIDDEEGICAWFDPIRETWMPMIISQENMLPDMETIAAELAIKLKKNLTIYKFSNKQRLKVIIPGNSE